MLFTILDIVMSVNRFDTKLLLLLIIYEIFCSIKKMCKYLFFRFSGPVVYGKQLQQIYNHDIYF